MERNVRSDLVANLSHIPHIRPATLEDAKYLVDNLRPADVAELSAAGLSPAVALEDSIRGSTISFTIEVDGRPAAMFGVAPLGKIPGMGAPWLLASQALFKISFTFRRHCREVVERMNELYPFLMNYVDARNVAAIQWLRWCGFRFTRSVPAPADPNQTFIEFVRHPPNV